MTIILNGTTGVTFPNGVTMSDGTSAPVTVAQGGTGANTASAARTALGVAIGTDVLAPNGSGANLTSLNASSVSSGTLGVANGGTGATTLTANNVLLGNGTSALQAVAPGTSGNVLTSNGTTWTSTAPPSSTPTTAQVLTALSGITDCTVVGGFLLASFSGSSGYNINATLAGSSLRPCSFYTDGSSMYALSRGTSLSGTWRQIGWSDSAFGFAGTGISTWLRIS